MRPLTDRPRASLAVLAASLAALGCRAEPTPGTVDGEGSVERGRAIYRTGLGASGRPLTARIGDGPDLPGSVVACVQCHGEDGRGRSEGGVVPPNIAWSALARPYGATRPDGRVRPPYTPALLAKAIGLGFDPAGSAFSAAMPRYQLPETDLADLIAFLQHLDADSTGEGVAPDRVRIGLARSPNPETEAAVLAVFDAINREGGIFRRRIEVVPWTPADGLADIFAILDAVPPGPRPETGLDLPTTIPVIAFQPDPEDEAAGEVGERSFALVSGQAGQARALAALAGRAKIGFEGVFAIRHGPTASSQALARAVGATLRGAGAERVEVGPLGDDPIDGALAVLFVGPIDPAEVGRAVDEACRGGTRAVFLIPRALVGSVLDRPRPDLVGRLMLAGPEFVDRDARRGDLATTPGLAVARLLIEGLKGTGRQLDRDHFVEAMEGLSGVRVEGSPPLHFGRGRHVGAAGAMILKLGPGGRNLQQVVPWLDLDAEHSEPARR
jgi:hypothetical protein